MNAVAPLNISLIDDDPVTVHVLMSWLNNVAPLNLRDKKSKWQRALVRCNVLIMRSNEWSYSYIASKSRTLVSGQAAIFPLKFDPENLETKEIQILDYLIAIILKLFMTLR